MMHHIDCAIMTEGDIDRVLTIERRVFPHPWSRNFFKLILSDMNNHVVILRSGGEIIGYGGYHLLKNRVQFLTAGRPDRRIIHLINIAIAPHMQHRGFGTFLMNSLLCDARSKNADYCYLEVRPSNQRAFSFYRSCGFSVIGIIENYYPQEREDALVMGNTLK
jgi:ribosomal-protein-alanine N-acetyltransferase